jgi:cysteine desulfurase
MRVIYMDNNATTQVDPLVFEEMRPFFTERFGNPSSIYRFGEEVNADVERARERVASALGAAHATEIIFTSCGTESDNTALRSALASGSDRNRIITTRVEHPAILNLAERLKRDDVKLTLLSVDKAGQLDLDELREAMGPDVAVVSIMAANNETGTLFPIEAAAEIAHEHGALFHTDAVQAVGKVALHLEQGGVDLLSLSGHKLHAPKGVGALYVRRGTRFRPFMIGGHQERGRRGGTHNVPGIVALGKACELAALNLNDEQVRVRAMRDRLEQELLKIEGTRLNGDKEHRLPNTANVSFKSVEGEAVLMYLDQSGICASSGSACTSGSLEPSHVLRAMGVPFNFAHGSIRFSLSRFNTDEDVNTVLEVMPKIISRLREISPFSLHED